jgi:hypothetical protein
MRRSDSLAAERPVQLVFAFVGEGEPLPMDSRGPRSSAQPPQPGGFFRRRFHRRPGPKLRLAPKSLTLHDLAARIGPGNYDAYAEG